MRLQDGLNLCLLLKGPVENIKNSREYDYVSAQDE